MYCIQHKEILEKKMEMLIKKIPEVSGLETTAVLNTKIGEVKSKIVIASQCQVISTVNVILKMMVHKIINCFSESTKIIKRYLMIQFVHEDSVWNSKRIARWEY